MNTSVQETDPEKDQNSDLTIEEMFEQLESLTERLEDDTLPMEDAFALYAKGLSLIQKCRCGIDEVERKVRIIEESGEIHEF